MFRITAKIQSGLLALFVACVPAQAQNNALAIGPVTGTGGGGSFSSICPTASNGQLIYDNNGACGGITGWTTDGANLLNGASVFKVNGALTQPAAPTGITATGSNDGSVNYRYVLVVHGAGTTAASPAMGSPFAGNSTLDGSHFNNIQTVTQTGCTSIDVYKTSPSSNVGLIGSTTCGGTFTDTGQTGNNVTATSSDTGSGGTTLTGPLVISNAGLTNSAFGSLQVGESPQNQQLAQAGQPYGYLASFSSSGTHNNSILIQSASTTNDPGIVFQNFAGTLTNPVSQGSGAGYLAGQNYVGGSVNKFYQTTFYEFGGCSGSPFTVVTSLCGRHQFGVTDGGGSGYAGHGFTIKGLGTYPSPLNTFAFLGTNLGDVRLYRVGYPNVQSVDDTTNYERFDITWNGTTAQDGPVAGGTGTLRPRIFTGTNLTFNSTAQAANTSSDGFTLADLTAATAGNQQYSPRLHFIGQVWSTTSVASSKTLDIIAELLPVQGSNTALQNNLVFSGQIAGGGYVPIASIHQDGSAVGILINGGSLHVTNAIDVNYNLAGVIARSSFAFGWSSATDPTAGTTDTTTCRQAAGVVEIGTTACNASGSLLLTNITASGANVIFSGLSTDAAVTDVTLCSKSSDGTVLKGSGTLGICLGTSSARYKHDIAPLDVGLAEIAALHPVKYRLDAAHGDPTKLLYGFTAEQGGKILPALMGRDSEGRPNTFDYLGLVPALTRAIQELKADNDNMRIEIEAIKRVGAR